MELRVHPAALRELIEAFDWCEARYGKPLAARFQKSVERAGQLLLLEPGLGTPATNGVRTLSLRGLPYTLVYQSEESFIFVIALMHQRRQPRYWIQRIPG